MPISTLPNLLRKDGCLVLPGVYDGISAKLATSAGFDALYMTGYGVVASALGVPDAGLATFTEMLDRVRCIAGATPLPFIADGDTGYGGLLNVDRTVRGYAAAGAAGELGDHGRGKPVGKHRKRPLEHDAHQLPVAGDRVLAGRRFGHASDGRARPIDRGAGDRRDAPQTEGAQRRDRQPHARRNVAERVAALVAIRRRVGQFADADAVEHDDDCA